MAGGCDEFIGCVLEFLLIVVSKMTLSMRFCCIFEAMFTRYPSELIFLASAGKCIYYHKQRKGIMSLMEVARVFLLNSDPSLYRRNPLA